MSRIAAENIVGWNDWAVISICEPDVDFGEAKLDESWFSIQCVHLNDTLPNIQYGEQHVLIADNHAKTFVDFVKAVAPKVEGIVVNCKAGISRSAAVVK